MFRFVFQIFCYIMNYPDLSGHLVQVCFVCLESKLIMEKKSSDFMHHMS